MYAASDVPNLLLTAENTNPRPSCLSFAEATKIMSPAKFLNILHVNEDETESMLESQCLLRKVCYLFLYDP